MESQTNRKRSLLLAIPLLISLILIVLGVYFGKKSADFIENSKTTIGEISDYSEKTSYEKNDDGFEEERIMYRPTISYVVNGAQYNYYSSVSSSSVPKIGKKKKIHYLTDDPSEAKLSSELYLLPFIFLFLGTVIFGVNILIIIKQIRRKPR
ncbi:MAG: DUF3592 domain-containing protein [Prolixibacteraceae bacterium]|nr:DUF3592 domain-containing protein [Prolixibacteraceae bacterium]